MGQLRVVEAPVWWRVSGHVVLAAWGGNMPGADVRRSFNFWISMLAVTPRANLSPGLFSNTY